MGLLQFITAQLSDQAGKATALLMPKNWRCLVNQAMEEIEELLYLQELSRISSEQLGLKLVTQKTAQHRAALLLSCYMERAIEAIHSLKQTLSLMQRYQMKIILTGNEHYNHPLKKTIALEKRASYFS